MSSSKYDSSIPSSNPTPQSSYSSHQHQLSNLNHYLQHKQFQQNLDQKTPTTSIISKTLTKHDRIKLFTWEFIWSFFMQNSQVRNWLFTRQKPTRDQVVKALVSKPVLIGYVFGHVFGQRASNPAYPYPDIGELVTVHDTIGDCILGFLFGYQNVNPLLVHLFRVIRDPILSNPRVVSRKFAYQKCPIPGANCYLNLELTWYESGLLGVTTSSCPIYQPDATDPSLIEGIDVRVFSVATAQKLARFSDDLKLDPNFQLPKEFLNPKDNFYRLNISEPLDFFSDENSENCSSTGIDNISEIQNPSSQSHQIVNTSLANDVISNAQNFNIASIGRSGLYPTDVAQNNSKTKAYQMSLWDDYQRALTFSKRRGVLSCSISQFIGGRHSAIFGRESQYTFLTTSGINAHGRIQRLCHQLGLDHGSPLSFDNSLSLKRPFLNQQTTLSTSNFIDSENDNNNTELDLTKQHASTEFVQNVYPISVPDLMRYNRTYMNKDSLDSDLLHSDTNQANNLQDVAQSNQNLSIVNNQDHNHSYRSPKRRRCNLQMETLPSLPRSIPNRTRVEINSTGNNDSNSDFRRTSLDIVDIISYDGNMAGMPSRPTVPNIPEVSFPSSIGGDTNSLPSMQATANASLSSKKDLEPKMEYNTNSNKKPPTKPTTISCTGSGSKTVWICDRCGVSIRGKKGNLNRHIANKHENIRAYACTVANCGRKFQTRLNLVRHETAVHQGRPFGCPECPRAFKYEDDRTAHLKTAHEEKNTDLACDVCGSCFGRRSTLNRHKAKVHKLGTSATS